MGSDIKPVINFNLSLGYLQFIHCLLYKKLFFCKGGKYMNNICPEYFQYVFMIYILHIEVAGKLCFAWT